LEGESEIHLFKSDALAKYHGRATRHRGGKMQEPMTTLLVGNILALSVSEYRNFNGDVQPVRQVSKQIGSLLASED